MQLKQEHGDLCTAAALRESEASQELTGMRRWVCPHVHGSHLYPVRKPFSLLQVKVYHRV